MSVESAIRVQAKLGKWARPATERLDVTWPTGLRGVVGTAADGVLALAPLLAGVERAPRGQVAVFGRDPARDPSLRARIGATFADPLLLDARDVATLVRDVDRLRRSNAASQALTSFGLASWRTRRLGALARSELRSLELVIALSVPNPLLIVLTEPTVDVAAVDRAQLVHALAQAAAAGACAVVASASMADTASLAPVVHLLERGRTGEATRVDRLGMLAWQGHASLQVDVDLPRILVGALSDDAAVTGVSWDQGGARTVVTLHGPDLDELALAIAGAAAKSGVAVRSIVPIAPDLEQIRARASGLALAAYHAGYQAHRTPHLAESEPVGARADP